MRSESRGFGLKGHVAEGLGFFGARHGSAVMSAELPRAQTSKRFHQSSTEEGLKGLP